MSKAPEVSIPSIDAWTKAGYRAQRGARIGERDVRYLTYWEDSARSQANTVMRLLPRGFQVNPTALERFRDYA